VIDLTERVGNAALPLVYDATNAEQAQQVIQAVHAHFGLAAVIALPFS